MDKLVKRLGDLISLGWNLLKGKKTYLVAVCAIVYGFYRQDNEAIIFGLGLIGLRDGIATEIAKLGLEKGRRAL